MEKISSLIDFLARYPAWVIVSSLGALFLAVALLVIFRPKPQGKVIEAAPQRQKAALAYISTHKTPASDLTSIRLAWHGPVTSLENATKEAFIDVVRKGYEIVHLAAPVTDSQVEFEDGLLSPKQLSELLSTDAPKLLVLPACRSFRVGKALEDSKIDYSIVAVPDLRPEVASTFFSEFYKEHAKGASYEQAYERAIVTTNALYDMDAREILMLTKYRR